MPDDIEVDLVPRRVLGSEADRLRVLSIGHPVFELVDHDSPEVDKGRLIAAGHDPSAFAFHRIIVRVTFRPLPRSETSILRAVVLVSLAGLDERCSAPLVWNMDPLRVAVPGDSAVTGSAGLTLKLPGVEATVDRSRDTTTPPAVHVQAYGEGQAWAEWRLSSSEQPIAGVYRLPFISRTPRSSRFQAALEVTATCRDFRGGVLPYRAEVPPELSAFVVGDEPTT